MGDVVESWYKGLRWVRDHYVEGRSFVKLDATKYGADFVHGYFVTIGQSSASVELADKDTTVSPAIGMVYRPNITAEVSAGADIWVQLTGKISRTSALSGKMVSGLSHTTGFTAGQVYYLADSGYASSTVPQDSGDIIQPLFIAVPGPSVGGPEYRNTAMLTIGANWAVLGADGTGGSKPAPNI